MRPIWHDIDYESETDLEAYLKQVTNQVTLNCKFLPPIANPIDFIGRVIFDKLVISFGEHGSPTNTFEYITEAGKQNPCWTPFGKPT